MASYYNAKGFWRDPSKRYCVVRLRSVAPIANPVVMCKLRVALYKARERLRGRH